MAKTQKEIDRAYRLRHKAKIAARRKAQYDADPDAARRYMRELRKKQRQENPEYYRAMIWRQRQMPMPLWPMPANCECCGREAKVLCLDHDHTTGAFRGWLCDYCNRGIGQIGDNLQGARKAVAYLERHEAIKELL